MAEKVKVSREVANFIEGYEANVNSTPGWEDHLIFEHSRTWMNGFDGVKEEALCMSEISPLELAEILTKGYETEEAPEEKILKMYKSKNDGRYQSDDMKWINDAYANGIVYTLESLGIKIKGIND